MGNAALLPGHSHDFFGVKCAGVEIDRFACPAFADDEIRRNGVVSVRNGFHGFCHWGTSGFSRTEMSLHLLEKRGNPAHECVDKKAMNSAGS